MNKFISTAIFYANSRLHIGNAYEAVYADFIARYFRMNDCDTFFMTGMDEHGQKIEGSAHANNMKPQKYVDKLANDAKTLFDYLQISNDYFIRTTDSNHKKTVQAIFQKLLDQGDIYLDRYEGNYCIACESFYTDSQLVDGRCPDCGKETTVISEESYFLNLKKYEDTLLDHIKANERFIIPSAKRNEIISFIEGGLNDLSVTRTSFEWGIKTSHDPKHLIYVWIDALTNYISALNYSEGEDFTKFWNNGEVVHIIGKDISRFHAIYWPIMLLALGEKLPDSIVIHGFLMMGDDKMSKSKGNVIYVEDYTEKYGIDALRYYLLTELANGNDGSITLKQFIDRYNFELVNDLSNLVNRTASMCTKYFDSSITYNNNITNKFEQELIEKLNTTITEYHQAMNNYDTKKAMNVVWSYIARVNKFIDETTPWILAKEDKEKLMNVLYILVESLRNIAVLINPAIPSTSDKINVQFGITNTLKFSELKYDLEAEFNVNKPNIIFSRLNYEEELEKMEAKTESGKPQITIDDFDKIELRVATVLECSKHPNADKLLLFKLQVGEETRQICSGIAEFYQPEELVGKNVVIVANLKPVKLRGELSEGMILSAELGDELNIVESLAKSGATVY